MSVRVRFAPSPTGLLHIGGARTALYNYLFAKKLGGEFILRIEDTDLERSKKEYEDKMIEDMKWFGLEYDEGPLKPGKVGPYRQSERLELYKDLSWKLVEQGDAYPCFLTDEELEALSEKATEKNLAPHTYHGQYRELPFDEAKKRVDSGDSYVIRFKNPSKKITFTDLVRGEVTFPEDMVGDFVIMRSNGMPVYNFCCVVDDWKMEISHVFRGEEHLNNTVRQLLIYEALKATPPTFGHVSLLVGEDRQKLSKRHAATSVDQYKELGYLSKAMANYLLLLGWSHPEEKDIFELSEVISLFDEKRFNKSSAFYDVKKLSFFNGQHMRNLSDEELLAYIEPQLDPGHPFHKQTKEWKSECLNLFKEKIDLPQELPAHIQLLFENPEVSEELTEINSWETTPVMREYLKGELEALKEKGSEYPQIEDFENWTNVIKKDLKIKGKPLFKGMRAILTGSAEGPDLKRIVSLTKVELILSRV